MTFMKASQKLLLTLLVLAVVAAAVIWRLRGSKEHGNPPVNGLGMPTIKVAIAPYQDMAMLMNAKPLELDKKHGIDLQVLSMAWQDLTPAVASATPSVDIAFASIIQFISQEHSLNANSSDPIVFFYPAYVFKGGAFVTFKKEVPELTKADLENPEKIKQFLAFRFAAQKTSSYEMLLSKLARKVGMSLKDLKVVDMDAGDGLLAAQNGSVDVSSAGLTQRNEAARRNGRVVLTMEDMGQLDVAGFIAKKSVITAKQKEIVAFLKVWTESCGHTLANLNANAEHPLAFLRKNSSTQYTPQEFANALSQEVLPTDFVAFRNDVLEPNGRYYYKPVVESVVAYYLETKTITAPPKNIEMLRTNQ